MLIVTRRPDMINYVIYQAVFDYKTEKRLIIAYAFLSFN